MREIIIPGDLSEYGVAMVSFTRVKTKTYISIARMCSEKKILLLMKFLIHKTFNQSQSEEDKVHYPLKPQQNDLQVILQTFSAGSCSSDQYKVVLLLWFSQLDQPVSLCLRSSSMSCEVLTFYGQRYPAVLEHDTQVACCFILLTSRAHIRIFETIIP